MIYVDQIQSDEHAKPMNSAIYVFIKVNSSLFNSNLYANCETIEWKKLHSDVALFNYLF